MKMLAHDLEHAAGRTAGRAAGGAGRWFDDRLGAALFLLGLWLAALEREAPANEPSRRGVVA